MVTSDAAKAAHKLAALLTLVRDDLEGGAEGLVVVSEPLQQRLTLDQLELHAGLQENPISRVQYSEYLRLQLLIY